MTLPLVFAPVAGILAKSGGISLDPIAKPLAAVLAFFYGLIPNYGIAIVLLTIAMMIVLSPLTIKQTRSMLVMQKLQPQLKKLQETHKNDRQALNEAVMALYKEHNASPLGGCLPMLLPLPAFFALFRILEGLSRLRTVNGVKISDPKYLSHGTRMYTDIVHAHGHLDAFGMDLAKSARTVGGSLAQKLPYFVLLLLMVGTQYYQQRQLTSRNPQAAQAPGAAMMKFFPILFGFFSLNFPAGVIIYWTVSNLLRIGQQWAMYRYDPKVIALVARDIKEVEAKTREIDAQKTGRPRLRDMLSNAAGAAAAKNGDDRKPGGKGATGSGNKPGGAKGAPPPAKGGRPGGASGKTSPSGANKAGTSGKAPVKAGSPKPNSAKPGGGRPNQQKRAGAATGANGGSTASKPGSGAGKKSGGGGGGGSGVGTRGSAGGGGGGKPSAAPPGKITSADGADAPPAGAGNSKPASGAGAGSGSDGSAGNGAGGGARDAGAGAGAGASRNSPEAANKGRTGGASSRSVSSRRRRRGR